MDLKTYQKPNNLYQYLDYSSAHHKTIFQSIVLGECARYVRSNTRPETFQATTVAFQKRLQERGYPNKMTGKLISRIKFPERQRYLRQSNNSQQRQTPPPPLFKCHSPPRFNHLKNIILQGYDKINHLVRKPCFVTLAHPNLSKSLIRAAVNPTTEQMFDIVIQLESVAQTTQHTTTGFLPKLRETASMVRPCYNTRCKTCTHLNCSTVFSSTVTRRNYPIRHKATCTSSNVIYLITCSKCKKQYVGMTTKQLNVRINHHRSNVLCKKKIYLCVHFNLPDHSLKNLRVQVIDRVLSNGPDSLHQLRALERYWIGTLKTVQPLGLNNSLGFPSSHTS